MKTKSITITIKQNEKLKAEMVTVTSSEPMFSSEILGFMEMGRRYLLQPSEKSLKEIAEKYFEENDAEKLNL